MAGRRKRIVLALRGCSGGTRRLSYLGHGRLHGILYLTPQAPWRRFSFVAATRLPGVDESPGLAAESWQARVKIRDESIETGVKFAGVAGVDAARFGAQY